MFHVYDVGGVFWCRGSHRHLTIDSQEVMKAMTKEYATIPFAGTQSQEQQLLGYIEDCKDMKGALIPVMQRAQAIYGYLPIEVQSIVANGLAIPLEEVYGVATFYSQFTLRPKGKNQISVCMGTACYVKGAGAILEKISDLLGIKSGECTPDGKFSLDGVRCIGACGLAPVMLIGEDVYGSLTPGQIEDILKKY